MSIDVSSWVWKHSESRGTDRLVLLAIADYANGDGTGAYPSDETLATVCRVDRATIRRCRNRLRDLGELDWKSGKRSGHSNRYRVVMDTAAQAALRADTVDGGADCATPPDALPGGANEPAGWRTRALPGGAPMRHDPSVDPSKDPSVEPSANLVLVPAAPATLPNDQRVFDAWIASTGKTGKTAFNAQRRRLIRQALKEYALEDVLDAVRGWKFSEFHCGNNPERKVWNDLGLLLRDASKIEMFRDCARGANEGAGQLPVPETWKTLKAMGIMQ